MSYAPKICKLGRGWNYCQHLFLQTAEAAIGGVLLKEMFLKFRKFYRKIPVLESLFNKVVGLRPATLLKRASNTAVFL